jgi:dipeptidyl aminopeptidase/acylaminoacyl peptidase
MLKNQTSRSIYRSIWKRIGSTLFFFYLFFLPILVCPLWGQLLQKKQLDAADYPLWGQLTMDKIAPNEKWVSYKMSYAEEQDTLFVRNTVTHASYSFPAGDKFVFTKDNFFVCQTKDAVHIVNLETGEKEILAGVTAYSYSFQNNLLLFSVAMADNKSSLLIRSPLGKSLTVLSDVTEYSLSPNGIQLLYTTSLKGVNAVLLVDLATLKITTIISKTTTAYYDHFVWQRDSKAVAFYTKSEKKGIDCLWLYTIANTKLWQLDPSKESSFPSTAIMVDNPRYKMIISDDLEKVFFSIKEKTIPIAEKTNSKVEIWNANDKWIYPEEQQYGKFEEQPKIALWQPKNGHVTRITSTELPSIMLSGNQQYAFLSNPKSYEPQFDYQGPRDYYIQNLNTFENKLFLSKQSSSYQDIIPSPNGKYMAYFRDHDWWVYDIKHNTHTNLTIKTGVSFSGKVDALKSDSAFGCPSWSSEDKEILLYDEFDIWAIKPDGSDCVRMTRGREVQISFRIEDNPDTRQLKFLWDGIQIPTLDFEKELFLKGEGADGKSGYFSWKKGMGVHLLRYTDSYVEGLNYQEKKLKLFWTEQRFDLPPRILSVDNSSLVTNVVFQSNPQQYNYYWGKSELIHFKNSKKENLKGILYYPANYDSKKKYPMIVNIYEKQSKELHWYTNPTLLNESGYNPTVLTAQGYFVFLPDIVHEDENVGSSSLDCVTSATLEILRSGRIKPDKIALMGHSFGGYETAFIANQSNLFATAIASGAILDITSFYLTVGWNTTKPDMWRFATEELRMGTKTPFANSADFDRNSPLAAIEKLNIPLLLWSGKQDTQVDWRQSLEYYLALRRLGKKNSLLLYPNENHTISNPTNQKDLTERVLQWFNYYLKEDKTATWIANGIEK